MFPAVKTKFGGSRRRHATMQKIDAARKAIDTGEVSQVAVQRAAADIVRILQQRLQEDDLLDILTHARMLAGTGTGTGAGAGAGRNRHDVITAEDVYVLHELIDQRM